MDFLVYLLGLLSAGVVGAAVGGLSGLFVYTLTVRYFM